MQQKIRVGCFREFQNSIADSSHQLLSDLIEKYELNMFTVTKDGIVNSMTGADFLFKGIRHNTQSVKSIEGIDIAWVEEAQTITRESADILTPTVRKAGSQIIWTYNRLTELDPIHQRLVMNSPPNTLIIQANYDVADKYGWLADEVRNEIEFDKLNNPELYTHKWLGEPLSQSERSIISRDKILAAMNRQAGDDGQNIYGVDVARMGNDRTVFWHRKGLKTINHKILTKMRTTEICDHLEQFVAYNKLDLIKIDDTGVGGGVTDEMMKRGYNIYAANFGSKAGDDNKYPNWISEAWFNMAEIIDEASLPMDSDLLMELSSRNWKQDSKGKRAVESKDEYKRRGYRSPDLADACIICYSTPKYVTLDDIAM
jgi:phage terminase large subunit